MQSYGISPVGAYVMSQRCHRNRRITNNMDEIVLGYFDEIVFDHKTPLVTDKAFQTSLEGLFEISEDENYFETKHALLKLNEDKIEIEDEALTMKIVLQVYLNSSSDIEQTKGFTEKLDSIEQKDYLKKEIYKSLGPEDFICVFSLKEQRKAWDIVEAIEKFKDVRDTYMTVILPKTGKLHKKIWIKQLYRLKKTMGYNEFIQEIKKINSNSTLLNKNQLQIFDTEGGYDFELWWEVDSFESIKKTYNAMSEKIDTVVSFVAVSQN